MRRLILITSLLLAGLAQAQAQTADSAPPDGPQYRQERPQHDPEARFAKLVNELGLSAGQQPKVRAILEATHAERRQLRETGREQHEALRARTRNQLAGVLTAEQLQRFEQLADQHRPPRGRRE